MDKSTSRHSRLKRSKAVKKYSVDTIETKLTQKMPRPEGIVLSLNEITKKPIKPYIQKKT